MSRDRIDIQAYRASELAFYNKIDVRTFKKWIEPFLKELGPPIGKLYNILQVELIFRKTGRPFKQSSKQSSKVIKSG